MKKVVAAILGILCFSQTSVAVQHLANAIVFDHRMVSFYAVVSVAMFIAFSVCTLIVFRKSE